MKPAITVDGLSKRYKLGVTHAGSIRELVNRTAGRLFRRARSNHSNVAPEFADRVDDGHFWALKDISFEVRPGEVLGIIGKNGAGKSTLLKLLSRITVPTAGEIRIHGRVASLLEVGTGFHPELTGRENVFLNGTILGMTKAEIKRRFDQILDFAGVEEFIDTPVKRYSSGMTVRLGFAIAAHLEPEILIVDEVLAVGDAEFQRKCFHRMQDVSRDGRTILFVSHNMSAVTEICHEGLLLEKGRLVHNGSIEDTLRLYRSHIEVPGAIPDHFECDQFILHSAEMKPTSSSDIETFSPVCISVNLTAKKLFREPGLYVGLLSGDGYRLTGIDVRNFQTLPSIHEGESYTIVISLASLPLLPGDYQMEFHLKDMWSGSVVEIPCRYPVSVAESSVYGGRRIDHWFGRLAIVPDEIRMEPATGDVVNA
jgi:lipopolysaccharide transport system ATP-binding protein